MVKITNNAPGLRGIRREDGRAVYLRPGETRDVELAGDSLKRAKRHKFLSFGGKAEAQKSQGGGSSAPALEAKHRGGGSYSIMRGDEEVADKLSKEDADAFNAMSDADKQAFVAKQ